MHSLWYPAEVVLINLYWKDAHPGKIGEFYKHNSSSLYNQAVEVIYQEAAVMLMYRHLLSELHKPVRKDLIESIY